MTNEQRARELADHCRYCDRLQNPHPALKCAQDHENNIKEIAHALDEAEARGAQSKDAEIAELKKEIAHYHDRFYLK